MFRKYRIAMIDGRPFPVHMAIADQWKVWYLNADMALSVANRAEEAKCMQFFDETFGRRHARAFAEMARRIGLDYFLIDCAETKDGQLLIFEADHCAIVHDMDPVNVYPYKPGAMKKLFDAFGAMLTRRAAKAAVAAPHEQRISTPPTGTRRASRRIACWTTCWITSSNIREQPVWQPMPQETRGQLARAPAPGAAAAGRHSRRIPGQHPALWQRQRPSRASWAGCRARAPCPACWRRCWRRA